MGGRKHRDVLWVVSVPYSMGLGCLSDAQPRCEEPVCLHCSDLNSSALQRRPLHRATIEVTREDVWSVASPITTRLVGCKQELKLSSERL